MELQDDKADIRVNRRGFTSRKEGHMIARNKTARLTILSGLILAFFMACQDRGNQPPVDNPAQNLPPTVPAIISPADGATDVSVDFVLAWKSSDPEGGPVQYDLYFGTDSIPTHANGWSNDNAFVSPWVLQENARQFLNQIYQMQIAYRSQYYRYCLDGVTAGAGDSALYDNLGIVPPANDPYLYFINAPPVILTCTATANLDSDPVIDAWTINDWGTVACGTNDIAIPLRTNIDYYWRVIARDDHEQTTIGPVWKFRIGTVGFNRYPETPRLISPPTGATLDMMDVVFQWECNNPDGGPLVYDVFLGRNPDLVGTWRYGQLVPILLSPPRLQARAGEMLQQIYAAQTAYHSQHGFYALNGFTANYRNDRFEPLGIIIDSLDIYSYCMTAAANTFTCVATANLDDDATNDVWQIDETGTLICTCDDSVLILLQPNNTTYYWRIVARDSHGHETFGPIWTFITEY